MHLQIHVICKKCKSRQWQQKALTLIMSGLLEIKNDFDWIIFDSSPGVTYDSLNAMSSSDAVVLVATPDQVDVQGTVDMSSDIYPSLVKFGAHPVLVLNKVPWMVGEKNMIYNTTYISDKLMNEANIPVISRCSSHCDSSLLKKVLLKEEPNHPLIKNIKEIVNHLQALDPRV